MTFLVFIPLIAGALLFLYWPEPRDNNCSDLDHWSDDNYMVNHFWED